jgi:hypothetical protein
MLLILAIAATGAFAYYFFQQLRPAANSISIIVSSGGEVLWQPEGLELLDPILLIIALLGVVIWQYRKWKSDLLAVGTYCVNFFQDDPPYAGALVSTRSFSAPTIF